MKTELMQQVVHLMLPSPEQLQLESLTMAVQQQQVIGSTDRLITIKPLSKAHLKPCLARPTLVR
jgi:hypothetical protein